MRNITTSAALITVCCVGLLTACTHGDDRDEPKPSARATFELGQSADTAGVGGNGTMRITPDTVLYISRTNAGAPEHDLYAVVTFSAENRSKTPVTATTKVGGFRWKATKGHSVSAGNSKSAARIAPDGFADGGPTVPSGNFRRNTIAFDIASAEKGGILVYVDGNGDAYRWRIPNASTGPVVSALKLALT
ncbi:hypothetical protein SAMN05428944_0397 [Streptomyces sp. 1222.5]|uniref:hypothetical protein n=1 Tax=unclassified Streptomyces TaxID=2593676 RepID=UPI000898F073|nr:MULTISPECIES: hypothetical protein [unclassified Streptomyces]PKW12347.1 hypothetical protein BX260_7699 [Streptomyces sp. 5112.2]SEB57930.1 hypothetical protein SAMN05428944_0397 [Streptomyces sp. 1222.5]